MKKKIALFLHLCIVISTVWAIANQFFSRLDVFGDSGKTCFKYFTTDSNVLACLGSLFYLLFAIRKKPNWVIRLRYAGTAAVTVTLLTVVLFLGPVAAINGHGLSSFFSFFRGNVFVLHFSTPVLSLIAFFLSGPEENLSKRDIPWAILPVFVYSMIYLTMVVFLHQWNDWYGFTFGGHYALIPIVLVIMYSANALIGYLLLKIRKNIASKQDPLH